jgi:hypothetical protein
VAFEAVWLFGGDHHRDREYIRAVRSTALSESTIGVNRLEWPRALGRNREIL